MLVLLCHVTGSGWGMGLNSAHDAGYGIDDRRVCDAQRGQVLPGYEKMQFKKPVKIALSYRPEDAAEVRSRESVCVPLRTLSFTPHSNIMSTSRSSTELLTLADDGPSTVIRTATGKPP